MTLLNIEGYPMFKGQFLQDPTGNYLGLVVEADSGTIRCIGHEKDEQEIQDWIQTTAQLQALSPRLCAPDMHDRQFIGVSHDN